MENNHVTPVINLNRRSSGSCFNKHDGLSHRGDGPSPHVHELSITEWSVARSDGPSCLLKQSPADVTRLPGRVSGILTKLGDGQEVIEGITNDWLLWRTVTVTKSLFLIRGAIAPLGAGA